MVYFEILSDERKEILAESWIHVRAYFDSVVIRLKRVMTDRGAYHRSHMLAVALDQYVCLSSPAYRSQERINLILKVECESA